MTESASLVMMIDDDQVTLRYYRAVLEHAGHCCRDFESPATFLAAYDPQQPGCLLLDVAMPGMTGPALQQRLNVMGAIIPVIFISGHANLPLAVEAMRNGAFNFLEKPVSSEDLAAQVSKALEFDADNRVALQQRSRIAQVFSALTERERDVLRLLITGQSNKVMATTLRLSPRTVELHRARLMEKTGSRSLAHLIRMAIDVNFVSPGN